MFLIVLLSYLFIFKFRINCTSCVHMKHEMFLTFNYNLQKKQLNNGFVCKSIQY